MSNGNAGKCPACGYALSAMATKCEACGTEIFANSPNRSVNAIVDKFQELESQLSAEGLSGKKLDSELALRKARYIRDIPVPNSREDLLSLLHFIKPRIISGLKPDANIEDWRVKFNEVVSLSKSAFKNDSKVRIEIEEIEKSARITMSGELTGRAKRSPVIAIAAGIVVLAALGGLIRLQLNKNKLDTCEEQFTQNAEVEKNRLEAIVAKANAEVRNNQFQEALVTSSEVRWGIQATCAQTANLQLATKWNQNRTDLEAMIRQQQIDFNAGEDKAKAEAEKAVVKAEAEAEKARIRGDADAKEAKAEAEKAAAKAEAEVEKARVRADVAAKEAKAEAAKAAAKAEVQAAKEASIAESARRKAAAEKEF